MQITVTQEDIKNGIPGSCGKCPIAIAARRAYGCNTIGIGLHLLHFCGQEVLKKSLTLPPAARAFIRDFDDRKAVQPFTFTLGD